MQDTPADAGPTWHDALNQPALRGDVDLWASDPALQAHAAAAGADVGHLAGYGARIGTAEMRRLGEEANRHAPELVTPKQAEGRLRVHDRGEYLLRCQLDLTIEAEPRID